MIKQILGRLPKKEKPGKSGEKDLAGVGSSLPGPVSDARTTTDLTMSSRIANPNNYSAAVTNPGQNYTVKNAHVGAGVSNGFLAPPVYEALPSLRDAPASEKPGLFLRKVAMCCVVFDFTDPTKDVKEKEIKRQTLLELVDYVTSATGKFPEPAVQEVIKMVSTNLFRVPNPAPRENKALESFDLEEEEPVMDPAWPHLQIVYELFLRFVQSPETDAKLAKRYVDHGFIIKLLDLFDSEDPREREYLKTILHRIYGKFMVAERALFLWNNDHIEVLIKQNSKAVSQQFLQRQQFISRAPLPWLLNADHVWAARSPDLDNQKNSETTRYKQK
ncbi:hypothetical protein E2562_032790 [Oryza meyeriana var. granulata]|uniref:Uncharacterized protein n=1 Tax=Oryza meyeriana var. granulata TaxID=110450 RepID=A0A6G1DQX7_9ORYZ|nr:hypothetical protein E2562_032790 [Oryza meyeriana var. granulata]